MLGAPNLSKLSRNWPLVVIAGVVGLAFGIAIFALLRNILGRRRAHGSIAAGGGVAIRVAVRVRPGGGRRIVGQSPAAKTDAIVPLRA